MNYGHLFTPEITREKTRQMLQHMLELARECLTEAEIRREVDTALGTDEEN